MKLKEYAKLSLVQIISMLLYEKARSLSIKEAKRLKEYVKTSIILNEKAWRVFRKSYHKEDKLCKKALLVVRLFIYSERNGSREKRRKLIEYNKNNIMLIWQTDDKEDRPSVYMYLPYARKGDVVQRIIASNGRFFEYKLLNEIRARYIKKGMIMADCGANIGNHSLYFAKVCGAKRVYSFESTPDTYRILKRNIELNKLGDTIEAFNVALGERHTRADISIVRKYDSGFNMVEENESGEVAMRPLDELIKGRIDFIKIDVEGFEEKVIKGADRILREQHPIIMIEIWKRNYEPISSLIKSYGYDITCIDNVENYVCTYKG